MSRYDDDDHDDRPRRRVRDYDDDDDEEDRPRRRRRYSCPGCETDYPPAFREEVSGGGWAVFWILLVFFFPLCWIGLLMRRQYRQCPECGYKR